MSIQSQRTQLHLIEDLAQGGAQTQLRLLLKAAAEKGDSVHVGSLSSAINTQVARSLRELRVKVHSVGRRFEVDPLAAIRLRNLVRFSSPDTIQTWDAPSAKTLLAARRLGVSLPWSHTVRELPRDAQEEASLVKVARIAREVVATTSVIIDSLLELGISESKLKVVPNAWEIPTDRVDQLTARKRLGLADGAKVIFIAMRMDRPTRLKEAIWAADLVRVLHPTVSLYVAGDGPARMACERFAAKATSPGAIKFLGNLGLGNIALDPREDLTTWIEAADVVWCPSDSQGMTTPMLEAMALARPVIAAKELFVANESVPAQRMCRASLLENGKSGWLVDWDDRAGWTNATDQMLNDRKLAIQIGEAGKAAVAPFHVNEVLANRLSDSGDNDSKDKVAGNDTCNEASTNQNELSAFP